MPRKKLAAREPATEKSLEEIKAIVRANAADPKKGSYDGLTSAEIGRYSRWIMFGDNDRAFPSESEWSRIVD